MKRTLIIAALTVSSLLAGISLGSQTSAVKAPSAHHAARTAAPLRRTAGGPEQLRRAGGWLVDSRGRVVILHGVNAVWKHAPYAPPATAAGFTAADADWLAANGFNAVRLGVLFAGVMPQPHVIDTAYLDKVDRVVQLLASRGIYVLIDFHQDLFAARYQGEGFPDWAAKPGGLDRVAAAGFPYNYLVPPVNTAFDRFWEDSSGVQADYTAAWQAVAARWRNQDHLMGYDLINEPWPGQHWPACAEPAGCAGFEATRLAPLYERLRSGIRKVDADNIVWFEPQILFDFGSRSHLGEQPVDDAQIGLSFHDYCLPKTLLQAVGLRKLNACAALEQRVFRNAGNTAAQLESASLLSEFGASDDVADTGRVAAMADQNLMGWMYWSYKDWGDPTTQARGSRAQGMFADDARLSTVKTGKLDALERPFPQAIAGTPIGYGYDEASSTFALSYSTRMAGTNQTVPAGLATDIFVPARRFPAGYAVAVDGGRVVSQPDAAHLLIEANDGARVVSVRLTGMVQAQAAPGLAVPVISSAATTNDQVSWFARLIRRAS